MFVSFSQSVRLQIREGPCDLSASMNNNVILSFMDKAQIWIKPYTLRSKSKVMVSQCQKVRFLGPDYCLLGGG